MAHPESIDPGALRRVILRGIKNFAAAEIRNEGFVNFLRMLGASLAARDLRFVPSRTFGEELAVRAKKFGDKTFLTFEGRRISYRELNDSAARVAASLQAYKVGHGGMAGILLPNLPAYLEIVFATQRVGACAVPINTALKEEGLAYILDNAGVDILFTTESLLPAFEQIRARLKKQPVLIIVPEHAGEPPSAAGIPYTDLLRASPQPAPDDSIPGDLPGLLMYTSGTTGHPKGVVYRYGHSQAMLSRLSAHLLLEKDEIYYTCLPLFHANALMVTVFHSLFADAQVVLSRRFSATHFWKEVRDSRATIFNTIGTVTAILMKSPPDALDQTHSVRKVISAACPTDLWVPFQKRFNVRLWEGFGGVDGGGLSIFNVGNAPAGSVGKPPFRTRYRLIDEAGSDVPVGTPGEMIHYVGHKKHGKVEYHANDAATKEKMRNGWVYTGDLMKRDAQGFLYFVGRKTDSMRCKGENVSALDVENAVDSHPLVLESAAFGVPSPMGEQDIMIVVRAREDCSLAPDDLHRHLAAKLPRFAVPKYIRLVEELPKTGTHRTMKHVLKLAGVTDDTWRAPSPVR